MRIAVTGHRPNKLGGEYLYDGPYTDFIRNQLMGIIKTYRPTQMISGMAQGVDTIWAIIAIKLGIRLVAAIPCYNQCMKWPPISQNLYRTILKSVAKEDKYFLSERYTNTCMDDRNKWMVNNCDLLVAVWDGTSGGTANCIHYAQQVGKEIKYIKLQNLKL